MVLVLLAAAVIYPETAQAEFCPNELVVLSPTNCTAIYCDLAGAITDLRTGKTKCYYDNCGVVYIENCK